MSGRSPASRGYDDYIEGHTEGYADGVKAVARWLDNLKPDPARTGAQFSEDVLDAFRVQLEPAPTRSSSEAEK